MFTIVQRAKRNLRFQNCTGFETKNRILRFQRVEKFRENPFKTLMNFAGPGELAVLMRNLRSLRRRQDRDGLYSISGA